MENRRRSFNRTDRPAPRLTFVRQRPSAPRTTRVGSNSTVLPSTRVSSSSNDIASETNETIDEVYQAQQRAKEAGEMLEIEYALAKEKARLLKERIERREFEENTIIDKDLEQYAEKRVTSPDKPTLLKVSNSMQRLKRVISILPKVIVSLIKNFHLSNIKILRSSALRIGIPAALCLVIVFGVFVILRDGTKDSSSVLGETDELPAISLSDNIPGGYQKDSIVSASPEGNEDVKITTLKHERSEKSIFISQQVVPADFDMESFLASIQETETFLTPLGTATTGILNNGQLQRVVSLVHEGQWVLMNTSTEVSPEDLKTVAIGLTLTN